MNQLGKFLLLAGAILIIAGLLLSWVDRLPWLGKLPGDFLIKKKNFTFYFPLATSILISLLISLLLFLLSKWK